MALMHERIQQLRKEHGYTLSVIAEYLGTTEATAQRYESGKGIKAVPYEAIEKYANLFGVSPSYIMGWDDVKIRELEELQKQTRQEENEAELRFLKKWREDVREFDFTDEEMNEITNFANYVISKRRV